jgi:hypothetical protein
MRIAYTILMLFLFPMCAVATDRVACSLENNGDAILIHVHKDPDALGGSWRDIGVFRIRTFIVTPANIRSWLLIEVYSEVTDGDYRIISAQKISAPFTTGRMEVVEPKLGRSLRYECGISE